MTEKQWKPESWRGAKDAWEQIRDWQMGIKADDPIILSETEAAFDLWRWQAVDLLKGIITEELVEENRKLRMHISNAPYPLSKQDEVVAWSTKYTRWYRKGPEEVMGASK